MKKGEEVAKEATESMLVMMKEGMEVAEEATRICQ
jgi:hypothetical protein